MVQTFSGLFPSTFTDTLIQKVFLNSHRSTVRIEENFFKNLFF